MPEFREQDAGFLEVFYGGQYPVPIVLVVCLHQVVIHDVLKITEEINSAERKVTAET
jgi:hypothetical protein